MHGNPASADSLYAIVLAGGDGQRTSGFITRWLGWPKPKQYCVFSGHRSLFQETLDRTERLTTPQRRVIVAAAWHRDEVARQLAGREPGDVVFQPANRGTAPGIFLPLARVRARDPEAVVAVFPSDHFIRPEGAFAGAVRRAIAAVSEQEESLVLLGAAPDRLERDYGWIEPRMAGSPRDRWSVRPVQRFVEKPDLEEARAVMQAGGLWNTFVMVGKVSTLWRFGWEHLPGMMPLFQRYASAVGRPGEAEVLEAVYRVMPVRDFSSNLLQHVSSRLGVIEMPGVMWSDWGRPERIAETLERVGQAPAFPLEALAAG